MYRAVFDELSRALAGARLGDFQNQTSIRGSNITTGSIGDVHLESVHIPCK